MPPALRQWRRDDLRKVGANRACLCARCYRPDRYGFARMDHRPGAAADATGVARADRRICWGWTFTRAGADHVFGYVASCPWDVDPTDWLARLVGRIALFNESEEFAFTLSLRRPANDLRRRFAFTPRRRARGQASIQSAKAEYNIDRGVFWVAPAERSREGALRQVWWPRAHLAHGRMPAELQEGKRGVAVRLPPHSKKCGGIPPHNRRGHASIQVGNSKLSECVVCK